GEEGKAATAEGGSYAKAGIESTERARNKKGPAAIGRAHESIGSLLFLLAAASADLGDGFAVIAGEDGDVHFLAEHFILQAALDSVAVFDLLVFLVELALDDLHVLGGGEGHRVTLLHFVLLAGHLLEGDLVAVDLVDDGAELFAHAEGHTQ